MTAARLLPSHSTSCSPSKAAARASSSSNTAWLSLSRKLASADSIELSPIECC
eukprot:CAMPEP_0185289360 /NCGR_PEP_ID=MMETSP1363-20130426/3872_1 /TAXON_ID=38817 /ORGANISM="Gephyrocapsa oceanica, Strain RCC1303" /LENGTH=52 /DNA_ID=CAMNT_0027885247 /DNA_START=416 /DNA_END=571 /DNA_ORIENTATION=-